MSLDHHIFAIGETLIILNGLSLPSWFRKETRSAEEIAKQVEPVMLTITEEVTVPGDYRPDEMHYGYKAKGSDGWEYACQYTRFCDVSTDPYHNWQRHYVPGVHYVASPTGRIVTWLIDEQVEFHNRYLWKDISSVALPEDMMTPLLADVNSKWPECELAVCQVELDMTPRGESGAVKHGVRFGPHYVKHGCTFCDLTARSEAKKAEKANEVAA